MVAVEVLVAAVEVLALLNVQETQKVQFLKSYEFVHNHPISVYLGSLVVLEILGVCT